jgi:hypothetical protein
MKVKLVIGLANRSAKGTFAAGENVTLKHQTTTDSRKK